MFLPVDQNIFFLSIANLKYFRIHNYIIIIQTLHLYLVYSIHYHNYAFTLLLCLVNIQLYELLLTGT